MCKQNITDEMWKIHTQRHLGGPSIIIEIWNKVGHTFDLIYKEFIVKYMGT